MRDKHNPYSTSAEALKPDFNRRLLYRRASVAEARVKELEAKLAVAIEALERVKARCEEGPAGGSITGHAYLVVCAALDKIGEKVE